MDIWWAGKVQFKFWCLAFGVFRQFETAYLDWVTGLYMCEIVIIVSSSPVLLMASGGRGVSSCEHHSCPSLLSSSIYPTYFQ